MTEKSPEELSKLVLGSQNAASFWHWVGSREQTKFTLTDMYHAFEGDFAMSAFQLHVQRLTEAGLIERATPERGARFKPYRRTDSPLWAPLTELCELILLAPTED